MILAGIQASFHLFNYAWTGVIRSPVSWHDRTPVSILRGTNRTTLTSLSLVGSSVGCPKVHIANIQLLGAELTDQMSR